MNARTRLNIPVITDSVINSEIIFFPDAPFTIRTPIPFIRLPVIDEYRLK